MPRPYLNGPVGLPGVVAAFRRPHLLVVAAVVALGLLVAGWAVLRARPVAVAVTPPPVTSSGTKSAPADGSSAGAPSPTGSPSAVVVHVLGAVRKPGLVSLTAGSRVQDALDAAGGLTGKADPGELNLAQPVNDGQQIVVGTRGKPSGEVRDGSDGSTGSGTGTGSGSGGSSGGAPAADQPVNLNAASQAQLEELPGVGPVMAGKIIAWRTEHGRFSRVEELQEIDGVGPKTYAKLAPLCRV
ncbi:MAG TPA: helix-hairpin-helix domain-containing protein [Microlunatus sp.]|nr:helix-hairpin-helix domain-containing protein [Microlunatus sp.]